MSRAVRFWKLEGAGNDFLGFDGRKGGLGLTRERIAFWCDRRRGAGADGVLVVEKRNPKVIPYLNVAAGGDSPFVERDSLVTAGTLVVTANQDEGDSVA